MAASSKPRVLLVEDDPNLGPATLAVLDMWGYDVHWASSSNEAFDEIAHDGFKAAVLDLNLGREDGVSLICSLRAKGHHIPPLIIVSAQTPERLSAASKATGALQVIRKPYNIAQLKAAIERALEESAEKVPSG